MLSSQDKDNNLSSPLVRHEKDATCQHTPIATGGLDRSTTYSWEKELSCQLVHSTSKPAPTLYDSTSTSKHQLYDSTSNVFASTPVHPHCLQYCVAKPACSPEHLSHTRPAPLSSVAGPELAIAPDMQGLTATAGSRDHTSIVGIRKIHFSVAHSALHAVVMANRRAATTESESDRQATTARF